MSAVLSDLCAPPQAASAVDPRTETLTHALLDACDELERNARDAFASARDTHEEFLEVWETEDAHGFHAWCRLKHYALVAASGRPWPFARMTREQQRAVGFTPAGARR